MREGRHRVTGQAPELCLVVPCFNEGKRWDASYWERISATIPCEFLFVDDGSTDETLRHASSSAETVGGAVLRLPRNGGKAEAVRHGLVHAVSSSEAPFVGFIDADGAFAPDEPLRLLRALQKAGAIDPSFRTAWSSRVDLAGRRVTRSVVRHYLGRILATRIFWGIDGAPYDSQAGLKLFANDPALLALLDEPFRTRWLFDIELFARVRHLGEAYRIWEEPVMSWHDVGGSKITRRELVRILREAGTVRRLVARRIDQPSVTGHVRWT